MTASLRRLLAGALLAALAAIGAGPPAAAAQNAVLADPPTNTPAPALLYGTGTCTRNAAAWSCQSPCAPHLAFGYNDSAGCLAIALQALDRGRLGEHLGAMVLPGNFRSLSPAEQLFVVVDLERIARHVPPLVGMALALDRAAAKAARIGTDVAPRPSYGPVAVEGMGAAWAGGSPNPVAAVFGWMYEDGWAGPRSTTNGDCTAPYASGCWGHRRVLLGEETGTNCPDCLAGSAYATIGAKAVPSYAFVIVAPRHPGNAVTFSWNADVLPYLPPSDRVRAR